VTTSRAPLSYRASRPDPDVILCGTIEAVTSTASTDEAALPDAIDSLYAAVAALVDPIKRLVNGSVLAAPSLYECLVGEIPAKAGDGASRGVARSLPTVWVDAVDLRQEIDRRVNGWQPGGHSTPGRLRALASRRWRPQDTRLIRDHSAELAQWAESITAMVEPQRVKTVSAPCPVCRSRHAYRMQGGERVRDAALSIHASVGCTCGVCGAHWAPDQFLFLCRLLGFALPAGVDDVSESVSG
jgi:hypothetical protein